VPKRLSRAVPKKAHLDLTPPEEIRARRIRWFVFLGVLVICLLGAGIYFAGPPVGREIKSWQSRRLAREAFSLIDQQKWSEANAKTRDAVLLRPTEPEAWRAAGRLASRISQWAIALDWWKKVDETGRLTVEDRRDYVAAALMAGEVALAAKQVQILMAQPVPMAADLMWAGQLASRQNDPVLAIDYAERVLGDERAKPYETASAATLILSLTSPNSQRYAAAWKRIEDVARDPKNPASLGALVLLANEEAIPPMSEFGARQPLSLKSYALPAPTPGIQGVASAEATEAKPEVASDRSNPPPTLSPGSQQTPATQSVDTATINLAPVSPPSRRGRTMSLTEVANALEHHPNARPYHKLLAFEVRAHQDPILTDQFVADAIQRFGSGDDETLAALGAWLNKIGRSAKTLEVLPQTHAVQRQDLFLLYINALAALQRWSEVKDLLMSEHSVVDPMSQHMYLAVAQAHLGSATAATNEWQRALEVANTPEQALALAKYAEQSSVNDIADEAYSIAIKIVPKDRGAYDGRLRLAIQAGHTSQAQSIAAEIAQLWPDDVEARSQDAYLQLLLGASSDTAKAAERDAQLLVAKEPRNWQARATLGLARLRLGRNKEALAAIREPLVTGVEPPGPLAVRAAILAANGYEDGARNDARLVSAKPLLPEERTLIAPLLAELKQ
jgi:tetratricopeptide (TPR) repeat protein